MRFNAKPRGRWKWLLILAVPVAALLVAGQTMNTSPPTNFTQTSPDAAPELCTRLYRQSVAEVTQTARAVAGEQTTWLRSWRVVPQTEIWAGPPHHDFKVEVPVLFFTDDLAVQIDIGDAGQTRVNVASKSRVGQGDFGENRRHVAQFLRALDGVLDNEPQRTRRARRERSN